MRGLVVGGITALLGLAGCEPSLRFERPLADDSVAGVVQAALVVEGAAAGTLRLYLDAADAAHAIGEASLDAQGRATVDWYTPATSNGAHTLLARLDAEGSSVETLLPLTVRNWTRDDKIPATAIKQTPALDQHPPLLEPAFESLFEPCAPLPAPLNSAGAEDSPFITPDGQQLYLFFTPDASIPAQKQLVDGVTGIWRAQREGAGWSTPERVFLNYQHDPALDGCGTVSGDRLWWCSARAGNLREIDIYVATQDGARWVDWRNAGARLNLEVGVGELHVTAGGRAIYFHAARAGGAGGLDLWLTRLEGERWSDPVNLAALNSAGDEGWPWVDEAEGELWFTRMSGAPEIWRALAVDGAWQAPQKVVGPFAGEPTLDDAGDLYFTHHFWDTPSNSMIEADLYRCARR